MRSMCLPPGMYRSSTKRFFPSLLPPAHPVSAAEGTRADSVTQRHPLTFEDLAFAPAVSSERYRLLRSGPRCPDNYLSARNQFFRRRQPAGPELARPARHLSLTPFRILSSLSRDGSGGDGTLLRFDLITMDCSGHYKRS